MNSQVLGDQGLNSNSKPERSRSSFQELDNSEKDSLFRKLGCLFGVRVDAINGPRTSGRAVARFKNEGQNYPSTWIREHNDVITDIIETSNERDTNYIHDGWSLIATHTIPVWTALRIVKNNQAAGESHCVTKQTIFHRLLLDMPLNDLVPCSEFEEDVRKALNKPANLAKFQALDRVFNFWFVVSQL
ncbi:hypothetical protein FRC12_005301 [Ceratobasidium sp. 428]|nr:hypothetical protein FRC12_005301 [Ceratobasidium sp. 428]